MDPMGGRLSPISLRAVLGSKRTNLDARECLHVRLSLHTLLSCEVTVEINQQKFENKEDQDQAQPPCSFHTRVLHCV